MNYLINIELQSIPLYASLNPVFTYFWTFGDLREFPLNIYLFFTRLSGRFAPVFFLTFNCCSIYQNFLFDNKKKCRKFHKKIKNVILIIHKTSLGSWEIPHQNWAQYSINVFIFNSFRKYYLKLLRNQIDPDKKVYCSLWVE